MYAILNAWKSLVFKLLSFISYNDIILNRRRNKIKKLPPNIVMIQSSCVYLPSIRLYIFCEIRRISQKGIWISVATIQNHSNQVWNQSKPKQDQFKCNEGEGILMKHIFYAFDEFQIPSIWCANNNPKYFNKKASQQSERILSTTTDTKLKYQNCLKIT